MMKRLKNFWTIPFIAAGMILTTQLITATEPSVNPSEIGEIIDITVKNFGELVQKNNPSPLVPPNEYKKSLSALNACERYAGNIKEHRNLIIYLAGEEVDQHLEKQTPFFKIAKRNLYKVINHMKGGAKLAPRGDWKLENLKLLCENIDGEMMKALDNMGSFEITLPKRLQEEYPTYPKLPKWKNAQ